MYLRDARQQASHSMIKRDLVDSSRALAKRASMYLRDPRHQTSQSMIIGPQTTDLYHDIEWFFDMKKI